MNSHLTRTLAFGIAGFWALIVTCRILLGSPDFSAFDGFLAVSVFAFSLFLAVFWYYAKRYAEAEFRRVSATDTLTGLYVGTLLLPVLEAELDRAKRQKRPLALLLIDIDYFSRFNRSYGFKQGDWVLTTFGSDIIKSTRRYDTGFRYGHDEFVLILPETQKPQARQIADRLQDAFANRWEGELSLSIGLAPLEGGEGTDAETLLGQASKALGEARRQGGNRCRAFIERGL